MRQKTPRSWKIFCNNPVVFSLHVQYKAEEESAPTSLPGCWELTLQGAGAQQQDRRAPAHAALSLSPKTKFCKSPRTWSSWQKCSISTSGSTWHCHPPSWPPLGWLQREKDSSQPQDKSAQRHTAELVQGSGSSPALIHEFQVIPPTSTQVNSEGRQLSHLKSRVTPFFMIYKIRCLHYLQARGDY